MIILQTILKALGAVGGGTATAANPEAYAVGTGAAIEVAAKGASFANGIAKFASGGIVSSPTLFKFADGGTTKTGLMGEAGPEAIMPLKRGADGKLGVAANLDGAMSRYRRSPGTGGGAAEGGGTVEGGGAATGGPMAIDVRYSVERINDVEYVTASQFQAGMRQAAQQGAAQGEQRTLRRLQQSPSTRKRVGV
jgi:phage-related minor tail protein